MKATFVIPGRLPSMNQYINACKRAWFVGSAFKKKQMKLIGVFVIAHKIPVFEKPVVMSFVWYEKDRRRDRDNIRSAEKYVMDTLTTMKRIKNDTQKWVLDSHHKVALDPLNPRVEVTIEEAP